MQELKINGVYKHFKGDYYLVTDVVKVLKQKKNMLYIENYMKMEVYGLDQ